MRSSFAALERRTYLDFAGIAPISAVAVEAVDEILDLYSVDGVLGAGQIRDGIESTCDSVAAFVGVESDELCFVRNTTHGLGAIANGLDLGADDRVIVSGAEFPSTHYPFATLAGLGVEVDVVEPDGVARPLETYARVLERTLPARVLATSWVQFSTGWRTDLGELGAMCRSVGTYFRGDPMCVLRWTTKSLRTLSDELACVGYDVSPPKIAELLRLMGYALQAPRKTIEGNQHPDRDSQFRYI